MPSRRTFLGVTVAIPFLWLPRLKRAEAVEAEVEKVHRELMVFRDDYLPVFFLHENPSRQVMWQDQANRLADGLLHGRLLSPLPFNREASSYSWLDGTVQWEIGSEFILETALAYCRPPCRSEQEFLRRLPETKKWLLRLSPYDLAMSLCAVLPAIADSDPAFALAMLNLERYRGELGAARRWFLHVINNTLLHVFAMLANNHFLLIRKYLDHSCLHGAYTHLMPDYVFGVLDEKARVLSRLQ